jgi:hypothetical protein
VWRVRGHVGGDDEDVLVLLVGHVLGHGERDARRDNALDGGVVGKVQEHGEPLERAVFLVRGSRG